jgi:thiol-disulfide isomerase/thioredoxin
MKTQLLKLLLFGFITIPAFTFAQEKTKSDSASIVFVDQVNSLDELFAKFKGKIIYVDFWASWCRPCIEELKHNDQIDSFMKENNIVRLYIALEKLENDKTSQQRSIEIWQENVLKYNLSGYNYYVQLRSDFFRGITEKIMKGKLSLPRFAIIDANGIIVDRDATSPSKPEKLINQLKKFIKKD